MALFYSSAFKTGPSAESAAVKNYNAAIAKAQAESDSGQITDPNTYTDLATRYLSPFTTDPTVQKAYYGAIADSKKIQAQADDVGYVKALYDANVNDKILSTTKDAVDANATPDAIVGSHAYWYDQAAAKLDSEIQQRKDNNQTTGLTTLSDLRDTYQQKANSLAELYNGMKSGDKNVNPENYGFLIQTNPNTGKVISAKLDTIDSLSKVPSGYVKTSDRYGGVPIFLNSYAEGTLARLGDRQYKIDTVKDATGGKMQEGLAPEAQHGPIYKFFHHGIADEKNTKTDLPSLGTSFDQVVNLPANSALRDSSNNYYFLNDKGEIYKGSADNIASMFNVSPEKVKTDSFFLSRDQMKGFPQIKNLNDIVNGNSQAPAAASMPSFGTPAPTNAAAPLGPPVPTAPQPQPTSTTGNNKPTAILPSSGPAKQQNNTQQIVQGGINKVISFGKKLFNQS